MPRHTAVLIYSMLEKTLGKRARPNRGEDGSSYIFHSAEGCQRYNEPQRAPKLHVVKNVYCTSGPRLYYFFLLLRHLTDHRETKKSDHCPYLTSLCIKD